MCISAKNRGKGLCRSMQTDRAWCGGKESQEHNSSPPGLPGCAFILLSWCPSFPKSFGDAYFVHRTCTHPHFHQQSMHRNESTFKTDKCQIICTFILSKPLPGTETLSLCNSSYHFAGNIPWANPRVRFALPGSSTFKIFHVLEHATPANHKVI